MKKSFLFILLTASISFANVLGKLLFMMLYKDEWFYNGGVLDLE